MPTGTSKFASSFAPYTPPPDDPSHHPPPKPQSKFLPSARPWFPSHPSTHSIQATTSYQEGGIPTLAGSEAGGAGAAEEVESQRSMWETTFNMRVDVLAAFAYLLGPISALMILIAERQNDYARFHAYQSALLTGPLLLVRFLMSLLQFPGWMRSFTTWGIILVGCYMAYRAYIDAAQNGQHRYHLPYIGEMAEKWLSEE